MKKRSKRQGASKARQRKPVVARIPLPPALEMIEAKAGPSTTPLKLPRREALERLVSQAGAEFDTPAPRGSLDEAQELAWDAWEAASPRRAVALARKALEISPDCADAYVILAENGAASTVEVIVELYRQGVAAGERALGERAFKEDGGHFWGILETRPYMRAMAGLGSVLWEAGNREEAVKIHRKMLRLNPNDNQGIRDLLMPRLILLGRDDEAEVLWNRYRTERLAGWTYARALLDFRKHGDAAPAIRSLRQAVETNEHVPGYLLGLKRMPRAIPDYHGIGDENEAIVYTDLSAEAWNASPGAIEWLAIRAPR